MLNMRAEKQKSNLETILRWQGLANIRQVKLQDRYMALAMDVLAVVEGKEPTKSRELI